MKLTKTGSGRGLGEEGEEEQSQTGSSQLPDVEVRVSERELILAQIFERIHWNPWKLPPAAILGSRSVVQRAERRSNSLLGGFYAWTSSSQLQHRHNPDSFLLYADYSNL